jgi:hypothetical protein
MKDWNEGYYDGAIASANKDYRNNAKQIMGFLLMRELEASCEKAFISSRLAYNKFSKTSISKIRESLKFLLHEKFAANGVNYWSGYLAAYVDAENIDSGHIDDFNKNLLLNGKKTLYGTVDSFINLYYKKLTFYKEERASFETMVNPDGVANKIADIENLIECLNRFKVEVNDFKILSGASKA